MYIKLKFQKTLKYLLLKEKKIDFTHLNKVHILKILYHHAAT